MLLKNESLREKFLYAFLLILGTSIQIQQSFFSADGYQGLRLNLADFILPFAGLFILISLIRNKSHWPKFSIRHTYLWLVLLGTVLTGALFNTYISYGELNNWGLINKVLGWIVLCAFFLLGSWLTSNLKEKEILFFLKTVIIFALCVSTTLCGLMLLQQYNLTQELFLIHPPITGLMANKNAFSFLFLSIFALINFTDIKIARDKILLLAWFIAPFIFIFTVSKAAFLAFLLLGVALIFIERNLPWAKIITVFVFSITCIVGTHFTAPKKLFLLHGQQLSTTIQADTPEEKDNIYSGNIVRLKVLETTFNMIKNKSVLGSGLGSTHIEQKAQWGELISIVDCTPLWLWAETGIIGLISFLGFYFFCLKSLWQNSNDKKYSDFYRRLNRGILYTMLIFGVMSLFHEILYTRFLWLFMGLALTYPLHQPSSPNFGSSKS